MGEFYEWVSLIEITSARVTKLGRFEVGGEGCGVPTGKPFQFSKRLLARKGLTPAFFAETFDKDCKDEKAPWVKHGPAERIRLDKDETDYVMVR